MNRKEVRKVLKKLAKLEMKRGPYLRTLRNGIEEYGQSYYDINEKAPIFLARQLMKHQAGLSWNEVSRRYVDSEPEFYVPDNWRARPEKAIKQGSGDTHPGNFNIISAYENFLEQAASYYDWMLEIGVAPEMARMVLPQSMLTEWIWSGNLLAFAHVYNLRMGEGAQHEARVFAAQLDAIIESLFPISWTALTREGK